MQKTTLVYALAPALMFAATIAPQAASAMTETRSQSISTADLDLSTAEGQKTLDARIQRVARDVCDVDVVQTGTRIQSSSAMACYREALRSARERVAQAVANQSRGG